MLANPEHLRSIYWEVPIPELPYECSHVYDLRWQQSEGSNHKSRKTSQILQCELGSHDCTFIPRVTLNDTEHDSAFPIVPNSTCANIYQIQIVQPYLFLKTKNLLFKNWQVAVTVRVGQADGSKPKYKKPVMSCTISHTLHHRSFICHSCIPVLVRNHIYFIKLCILTVKNQKK